MYARKYRDIWTTKQNNTETKRLIKILKECLLVISNFWLADHHQAKKVTFLLRKWHFNEALYFLRSTPQVTSSWQISLMTACCKIWSMIAVNSKYNIKCRRMNLIGSTFFDHACLGYKFESCTGLPRTVLNSHCIISSFHSTFAVICQLKQNFCNFVFSFWILRAENSPL